MTYGEIRTTFLTILNRSDCTDAMADDFLEQGMARSQRMLKLPPQESLTSVAVGDDFEGIDIPDDALRIINLYIQDGTYDRVLTRISLKDYLAKARSTDTPLWWTRNRSQLLLNPTPSSGTTIKLLYYAEFNSFTDDNDDTALSIIAPDLFIYGGLVYAADKYLDERLTRFENRYQQIIAELQNQADEDELSGGAVISSAYEYPEENY
jgi:hypothetical protein